MSLPQPRDFPGNVDQRSGTAGACCPFVATPESERRPRFLAGRARVNALREHHKAALELRMKLGAWRLPDDALLLSNLQGKPLQPSNVSSDWGELAERIGVPGVTFHELRHTHASQLPNRRIDHNGLSGGCALFTALRQGCRPDHSNDSARDL
jgi:integrase